MQPLSFRIPLSNVIFSSPDGQKRKVLNKFLKKKFPKLPDVFSFPFEWLDLKLKCWQDLEAKYREECKTQWLTQKENETEWIENCIERTARNNKFCYDVNGNAISHHDSPESPLINVISPVQAEAEESN